MRGARTGHLPFLCLATVLALAGCGREAQTVDRQFLAFGTLVEVSARTRAPERAEAGVERVRAALQRWHEHWHPWEGDGLARINRALGAGDPAAASPELTGMLTAAARYYRLSGGLFDPAVAGLVRLWGFSDDASSPTRPPSDAAIAAWQAERGTMADLTIMANRVVPGTKPVQIDLGGFAKGYAVDRALDLLRAEGVENVIVNTGGDLRVLGSHGDRPWRVGIRAPRGGGVFAAIEAADGEAVFTSGDYERYFQWRGRRYHHILDPRTGRPARGLRSVTVITDNGGLADAAATALFVAGADWPTTAREMGIDRVMAVTEDGTVELSPAMAARVRFIGERPEQVTEIDWR